MRPVYVTANEGVTPPVVLDYIFRSNFQVSLAANITGEITWTYEYTDDNPFGSVVNWTQCPEVGEQTISNIIGIETNYKAVRGRILDGNGTVLFSVIQNIITTFSNDQYIDESNLVLWGDGDPMYWGDNAPTSW